MYVAVKGGERAIANAHALLAKEGAGTRACRASSRPPSPASSASWSRAS